MERDGYPSIRAVINSDSMFVRRALGKEHPQMLAVMLSFSNDVNASVRWMPKRLQTDVILRAHYVTRVRRDALCMIEDVCSRILEEDLATEDLSHDVERLKAASISLGIVGDLRNAVEWVEQQQRTPPWKRETWYN